MPTPIATTPMTAISSMSAPVKARPLEVLGAVGGVLSGRRGGRFPRLCRLLRAPVVHRGSVLRASLVSTRAKRRCAGYLAGASHPWRALESLRNGVKGF